MNLWIVHADPALRQSLAASLRLIWPKMTIQDFDPDQDFPAPHLLVTDRELPGVPAEQTCLLPQHPLRLKEWVKDMESRLMQSCWPAKILFDEAWLDTRSREWHQKDEQTALTEKEVGMIVYLSQQNAAITREDLLRDVWHYAADADTHTIETHIYRLRQKIETDPAQPRYLVTTKEGYQLAARTKA